MQSAAGLPAACDPDDALDSLHGHREQNLQIPRQPVPPRRHRPPAGEVGGALPRRVDEDPAQAQILLEVGQPGRFLIALREYQGGGDHLVGVEEVHPERGGEEPALVGFGCDDARKDGFALVVEVHGGYELRRQQPRWVGVGRRGVVDGGKGVGEDGAVGGGEGSDEVSRKWLVERGPGGGADVPPEMVVGAEMAEVEGGGGCGGEGGTVEAIKDVE